MTASASALTIETLEQMFVYLGCANIPTQKAMDGAVPLESIIGSTKSEVAACFEPEKLSEMPADWDAKAIWFSGEHLGVSTVENVHWSKISNRINDMTYTLELAGYGRKKKKFTECVDGYVRLYYSEIDRFGRFIKFPVSKRYSRGVAIKKEFNPNWVLAFGAEEMRCFVSSSDALFVEKNVPFLAPFMCGIAQSLGSYWLVKTRFDSVCPSLTLLTDPTGVKEFWKLRDVPPGKSRRAALLHWVEQHWRQMRSDPDVETFVRAHMRGQSQIKQGSFEATVTPSVRDTLDAEKAMQQRELMRKRREDRRRRSSLLAKHR